MNITDRLSDSLGLPRGDSYTQDWAYELPDEFRTETWLGKYVDAYLNGGYSEREQAALMELMLDVSDDLIALNPDSKMAARTLEILAANSGSYCELLDYWALDEEPLENCFALTPKIRTIKARSAGSAADETRHA